MIRNLFIAFIAFGPSIASACVMRPVDIGNNDAPLLVDIFDSIDSADGDGLALHTKRPEIGKTTVGPMKDNVQADDGKVRVENQPKS